MKLKKSHVGILIAILISVILIVGIFTLYNKIILIKPISVKNFSEQEKIALNSAMKNYCRINNNAKAKDVVNILSLTDMQYCGANEKLDFDINRYTNKINLISKLNNMDLAVSIGDLNVANEDKETSLKNLEYITNEFNSFEVKTLFTLGNHDRFVYGLPQYDISAEEYYNIALSGLEDTCNFNKNEKYTAYYYNDIEDKKMRICVLNCFSAGNYEFVIDDKQLEFIANEMLDFSDKKNPDDWTIGFFIHTMVPVKYHLEEVRGADILLNMLSAYKNGGTYTNGNIIVNYPRNKRATISAIFTGHHHHNYTLQKDGILIIGMDTVRTDYNRADRYSEHSDINVDTTFEIISIDTASRTIYSTKVGNGENRFWNY